VYIFCVYILPWEYIAIYAGNLDNNYVSGLGPVTRITGHVFLLISHSVPSNSNRYQTVSESLFVLLKFRVNRSIRVCQAKARRRPTAKSADTSFLLARLLLSLLSSSEAHLQWAIKLVLVLVLARVLVLGLALVLASPSADASTSTRTSTNISTSDSPGANASY
jgi:hypothetical protein